jgi:hypothetical protein
MGFYLQPGLEVQSRANAFNSEMEGIAEPWTFHLRGLLGFAE